MKTKYKRMINATLETGKCNEWEEKVLSELLERDEEYNITLTIKQRKNVVEKCYDKYIKGIDSPDKMWLPTEYNNCKLVKGENGYEIQLDDIKIPTDTTKKEGSVILAWLTKAIPYLYEEETPEEIPEEEEVIIEKKEEEEELPIFDKSETPF